MGTYRGDTEMNIIRTIAQIGIIFCFYLLGEWIVDLTGIIIPGSIIGLVLLWLALFFKVFKVAYIQQGANLLLTFLDADKEGFLRSHRSLTQTVGRAARNVNGLAIMYADRITDSMKLTIDETERRREIQMQYNKDHNKTPQALNKKITKLSLAAADFENNPYEQKSILSAAAEEKVEYSAEEKNKLIDKLTKEMEAAAKNLDFLKAAEFRDKIKALTTE